MPISKPSSRMLTINPDKQQNISENICKFSSFQSSIQGENNVDKIIPTTQEIILSIKQIIQLCFISFKQLHKVHHPYQN